MNFKNLVMWAVIVLLSVGLFNMFQDPKKINSEKNKLPFSTFMSEVDAGRVVEVQIQGNNIYGVLSDGNRLGTCASCDADPSARGRAIEYRVDRR